MAPKRDLKPVAVLRRELIASGTLPALSPTAAVPLSAAKTNKEKRLDKKRMHQAAAKAELVRLNEKKKRRAEEKEMKMLEKKKVWVKKMLSRGQGRSDDEDTVNVVPSERTVVLVSSGNGVVKPVAREKQVVSSSEVSEDESTGMQLMEVLSNSADVNGNGTKATNGNADRDEESLEDDDASVEDRLEATYVTRRGSSRSKMNDSRVQAKKLLQWLLDPIPVAEFMKNIFEKRPLHVTNRKTRYYKNLFSTQDFDVMLRKKEVWFGKNLDVVKCKNGVKETLTPDGERANPSRVWGYFNEGCSIRMLNPQTFSQAVWRLASTLTEFFNSFVGCNMYLTPAGTQGFAAHYDDIDAFILQIEGKKHWKVYNPLSEERTLPRLSSEDFLPGEIGEPVLDVVLQPGDLLYMPRGFIHHGKAAPEVHSLHLTISSHQRHTWGDFLMRMMPAAVQAAMDEDVEFRHSLPIDFPHCVGGVHSEAETPQRKAFFNKLGSLVSKLMYYAPVDATADQVYVNVLEESLPPVLSEGEKSCSVHRAGEPWTGVKNVKAVTLDFGIGVRLVRFGSVRLVGEGDEIRLHHNVENTRVYREVGPKYIVISEEQVDLVEALIHSYPQYVQIGDLPDVGDDVQEKLRFVTVLYETGLLLTDAPVLAS